MTPARVPSFRWSALAFVAITAVVLAAATGVLVLLDPRSQAWWGGLFSSLGTYARSIVVR
ncbi:MAG: hypothetical protein KGJ98_02880 [Chloroflexota bacterium]|nr:hypothetical protein [Chloroflexota bacterium]MDE3101161.1 hypothetical protein [Chloroflexota bacterium]